MKMVLSSKFGNVFSVLVASIFLPFLPMIPIQILIQNLIYDFTQIAIPWDNVDKEFMLRPKKWDMKSLSTLGGLVAAVGCSIKSSQKSYNQTMYIDTHKLIDELFKMMYNVIYNYL